MIREKQRIGVTDIVKRAKMGAALQSVTDILLYMNRTREL